MRHRTPHVQEMRGMKWKLQYWKQLISCASFSTVKSEDSEPKNVTLYITELFSAGIWLHRLGSKWTITKGLEMFIILIRLLLNVSRHNASTFLIISLYCNNNHMWEIVTS